MKPFKEAEGYLDDLQAAYDYYKLYGLQTAERFWPLMKRRRICCNATRWSVGLAATVGDR